MRKSNKPTVYTSATGKEYVIIRGKTFKCCRKDVPHPDTWIWMGGKVKRYVCNTCF